MAWEPPKSAAALHAEGCTFFFVAHLAEAVALRAALGERAGDPGAQRHTAGRRGRVRGGRRSFRCSTASSRSKPGAQAAKRAGRRLGATLQVDSGMSRLGMPPAEVERLAAMPRAFDGIEVGLVMSHLACADEPEHPANEAQLAAFEQLRKKLPAAPASLANSSGIFLGARYHFDLARPGRGALRHQSDAGTGRTRCGRWCGLRPRSSRRATCRPAPASAMATPSARPADAHRDDLARLCRWLAAPRRRGRVASTACDCRSSAACRWTASSSTYRRCRPAAAGRRVWSN